MNITFLGTGTSQGIPVIACGCEVCSSLDYRDKRLRSSIYIEVGGKGIVIDTGPDFRQQMLREKIPRLDAVLYTHEHKDHTAGLDDIRGFNFSQRESIPIYARKQVINQLKKEFAYIFEQSYPGIPQLDIHQINGAAFDVQGIDVLPIEVMHLNLPVYGFRIDDFTYITDANQIEQREVEKIKGSRILVLNALQLEQHISHFNLDEALEVIHQVAPEKAYLTHLGHRMGLHDELQKKLPEGVHLAHDGLKISI